MEKALLISIKLRQAKDNWRLEDIAAELEELVKTSGAQIIDNIALHCEKITPNFFIGKGQAEEIAFLCTEQAVDTVIFSLDLSGTQQRNLEDLLAKKVIDRTQLILDIFARHAKSPEGKMQVELAQLEYLLPRLVGKGIILSRLGGGIGTRGPGEQKLEVDRRMIRKRIDKLKSDLKDFTKHRENLKKKRKENLIPTVSLIGYTNAGKSTLLNALTQANQAVSDGLFTTLDTLYKSLQLDNGENIVVSDTVGFLYGLPHHLIEAFKATLEEVLEADLLIHVLDASNFLAHQHSKAVFEVLKELGVKDRQMITVLNKIDLIEDKLWLERIKEDFTDAIEISAKLGLNLNLLKERIEKFFIDKMIDAELLLPHSRMDLVDLFYREGKVKKISYLQKGIKVRINLPKVIFRKLLNNKEIEICN
jgi:GTP-binding protein HflX